MDKARLNELIEIKDAITSGINEELGNYDLYEYDLEFDRYYPVSFAEYPQPLKDYLQYAWEELDKINHEIKWIENFLEDEEVRTNKMLEELYDYDADD